MNTESITTQNLEIQDWGMIDYFESNKRQLELVEKVHHENLPGIIVFCTHPEVVTLGRATEAGDVFSWDGPIAEISRGGRATYHGPSQLVIYPIINLKHERLATQQQQDVVGHLRRLENAIVDWLKTLNIDAEGKSLDTKHRKSQVDHNGKSLEETGVWVDGKKVASLGIAVKKWVTYHGAAINLLTDNTAFRGMHPCGFSRSIMTDVQTLLGRPPQLDDTKRILAENLAKI
ncbi:MAG: lipoyl(octanoyl) transferase LipB [Bdellovibrionaceae bacterium]|nr:lipoyl(octanoyl) transferase LipB [Pseudobdellovibrionaceae bacterium]